jgi:hypothetical protein
MAVAMIRGFIRIKGIISWIGQIHVKINTFGGEQKSQTHFEHCKTESVHGREKG